MATGITGTRLGAYIGNPSNASAAEQATYDAARAELTALMGVAPALTVTFVDQRQPVSSWIGNSNYFADSTAAAASSRDQAPVIAVPLSSLDPGAGTANQQHREFAAGAHDDVLRGIVRAWTRAGFKDLTFRPGWEMNIQGPTYAGDTAAEQADWVAAFRHTYQVIHQAAAAEGATATVIWNPSAVNYSNASATGSLYPGDAYVDGIGIDMYADIYPYSDTSPVPSYHDWATGGSVATVAEFIANPVNRSHYWSYPAATVWQADSSGGHSQSFRSLAEFAVAHGKPLSVPETGAGGTNGGVGVRDDAEFPRWLAGELASVRAAGGTVSFVGLWDSNGGNTYRFSGAADGKPLEAQAWAKYFGAGAPGMAGTLPDAAPNPAPVTVGTGPDRLTLQVSEDAWMGDAQYAISVDGRRVGGTLTATASHAAGASQAVTVLGAFGPGPHTATIEFLNDAWGGTDATDRNLYVTSATINEATVAGAQATFLSNGTRSIPFQGAAAAADAIVVRVSEDAWQGDAQFTVRVDGVQVGGTRTATASHAAGEWQDVRIEGSWGAGAHTVGISFINDAWGGTAGTDRNLYVGGASYDGRSAPGGPVALFSNGTASFRTPEAAPAGKAVTLLLAEDAWQGDARYSVSVDGGPATEGTVTALAGLGRTQAVSLPGVLAAGMHDVAVSFLNDAWGGTAATDRNLYVRGVDVGGAAAAGVHAELYSAGTAHLQVYVPAG